MENSTATFKVAFRLDSLKTAKKIAAGMSMTEEQQSKCFGWGEHIGFVLEMDKDGNVVGGRLVPKDEWGRMECL